MVMGSWLKTDQGNALESAARPQSVRYWIKVFSPGAGMNGNGSTAAKSNSIRVVLGDNTAMEAQLLADALHRSRQFGTVAAASRSSEILALVEEIRPDVLVLSADLEGEALGGATLVRELLATRPDP